MLDQLRGVGRALDLFRRRNSRERPEKIPHAPPLSGYVERVRVVPDDRLSPDSAHQATEGNCRTSTENCSNLALSRTLFPSGFLLRLSTTRSCADKAYKNGHFSAA